MARRREFDYDTAVIAARNVFWERGYASTSLNLLQAATGMSRSSLYETFGSKRELFGRVVDNYLTEVIGPLLEPMEAPGSGRDDLVEYFLSLARFQRSAPRRVAARGCLMLNTFMELNDLDAAAAAQVRGYRRRVRAAIRTSLTGSEAAVRDVEATADLLTNSQIGVMATSRIDPIQAAELAEMVAADITGWPKQRRRSPR